MVAWRLAALWLGLIAATPVPEARGGGGEVVANRLDVVDEPDEAGYASGELRAGDRVAVVADAPPGWLAIAPPLGAFDWVDASAIRPGPDGAGEVIKDRAAVRSGSPGTRMPGPPRDPLSRGATVRLLDRDLLDVGRGRSATSWRAIAPRVGEVRYVRAEGVRLDPAAEPAPAVDDRVRPAQFGGGDDPARRFEEAIRRSRARDHEVAQVRQRLADARSSTDRGYDAKGLLQASSRRVDGERVHALIGPEGVPIAYLAIPPGIPATRLLARKVGVRGEVHYSETLRARLITVRDLEALDRTR